MFHAVISVFLHFAGEFLYIRDTDGAVVRPLPRAKRMLSDATCLPHVVQVASFFFFT